jgi:hypothetical protein
MNETRFRAKIVVPHLKSHGWRILKMHGSPYMEPGIPDLLCWKNGIYIWIETKVGNRKLSDAQVICHRNFRKNNALVFTINNVADLENVITNVTRTFKRAAHEYSAAYLTFNEA